uniref:Uncharacterized protein n=1 Tax=Octopus bimaculoides TaxID=37653 RepID=A0A0L8GVJ2_OCTBM
MHHFCLLSVSKTNSSIVGGNHILLYIGQYLFHRTQLKNSSIVSEAHIGYFPLLLLLDKSFDN